MSEIMSKEDWYKWHEECVIPIDSDMREQAEWCEKVVINSMTTWEDTFIIYAYCTTFGLSWSITSHMINDIGGCYQTHITLRRYLYKAAKEISRMREVIDENKRLWNLFKMLFGRYKTKKFVWYIEPSPRLPIGVIRRLDEYKGVLILNALEVEKLI